MERYYNIHNLLRVYLNSTTTLGDIVDIHLNYFRSDRIKENDLDLLFLDKIFPPCNYLIDSDEYAFDDKRIILKQGKLRIEFMDKRLMVISPKAIPPHFFLQILLLSKNCTFIHSGGIAKNGNGIIFSARGGIGKTALVSILVKENGMDFLGDDFLIISKKGEVYSCPFPFSIYYYHKHLFPEIFKRKRGILATRRSLYFVRRLKRIVFPYISQFPYLERLARKWSPEYLTVPATTIIPEDKIIDSAVIKTVVSLERWQRNVFKFTPYEKEKLAREMISILQGELMMSYYQIIPKCFWVSALAGEIDLVTYFQSMQDIIMSALKHVKSYKIWIPQNINEMELRDFVLNNIKM